MGRFQLVPYKTARHPRRPVALFIIGFYGAKVVRYPQRCFVGLERLRRDKAPAARCLIYSYFAEASRVGVDQGVQGVEGVGARS